MAIVLRNWAFLPLLFAMLVACGGGGGSSSGGAGGTVTEPAVPSANYSGTQNQATLSAADGYDYAQELFAGIQFMSLNAQNLRTPTPKSYSETLPGSVGGAVTLVGIVNSDGTGWLQETFGNYASTDQPGVVQNGIVDLFFQAGGAITLGLDGFQITEGNAAYTYTGSVTVAAGGSAGTTAITGSVTVAAGKAQVYLSGLAISETNNQPTTVSGRLYDSRGGYVDISTPAATIIGGAYLSSGFPNIYPNGSGKVLLSGAGGTTLEVVPLDGYFVYLGLDSTGSGNIDAGARLDMSTGALDAVPPNGSTVSALIELPNGVTASGPVVADGRFSYTPGGFVNYQWSLLAAPFGSAAKVSGTGPTVAFTPDVVGDYLVQLTASAGGRSATDVVPVNYAGPGPGGLNNTAPTTYKVASFGYGHVGKAVTLDARASTALDPTGTNNSPGWTLVTPAGSHATVAASTAVTTTFTPDVPGIYFTVMGPTAGSTTPVTSVGVVSVDEPLWLTPPALVSQSGSVAVNAGPSGGKDTLGLIKPGSPASQIQWWSLGAAGLFTQAGSVSLGNGYPLALLATDLNGDGIPDFVATGPSTSGCPLDIWESGTSGYTLSPVPYLSSCTYASPASVYRATTVAGHPAAAALETGMLGGSNIAVIPTGTGGSIGTPVVTTINYPLYAIDFRLEDLDGDGIPDLVTLTSGITVATSSLSLNIYHGNGDGSFTYKSTVGIPGPGVGIGLAVGDFNGDGKGDIAVATDTNTLEILYGDGVGGIGATDPRTLSCPATFLESADLNGDGHPDLVIGQGRCASVGLYNGVSVIGLLLSQVGTSGSVSLQNEMLYPVIDDNPAFPSPSQDALTAGNFSGNGQQSLILRAGSNLLFIPSLSVGPTFSVKSSDAVVRSATVSTQAAGTTLRSDWVRSAARHRVPQPPL